MNINKLKIKKKINYEISIGNLIRIYLKIT